MADRGDQKARGNQYTLLLNNKHLNEKHDLSTEASNHSSNLSNTKPTKNSSLKQSKTEHPKQQETGIYATELYMKFM